MSLDTPQTGLQLTYDETTNTWRLASTGAALSQTAIHEEIRGHAVLTSTMFSSVTDDLYNGVITVEQWQATIFADLKEGHIASAMFAAGTRDLSPETLARLEQTLASEANYLAQFAQDIADGKVSFNQARARAAQYAKAMEQSYWNEWQAGLTDGAAFAHLDELPTVPGAGDTRCHGNCQCILEYRLDGIWWVLFPAEHCPDCLSLAGNSPYRSR